MQIVRAPRCFASSRAWTVSLELPVCEMPTATSSEEVRLAYISCRVGSTEKRLRSPIFVRRKLRSIAMGIELPEANSSIWRALHNARMAASSTGIWRIRMVVKASDCHHMIPIGEPYSLKPGPDMAASDDLQRVELQVLHRAHGLLRALD